MEKNEFWQGVADCWCIPWEDDSPKIQIAAFDEPDSSDDLDDELKGILDDLDFNFL